MHPLVKLAKDAVELYVRTGKRLDLRNDALEPELRRQAGVFVCLKIKGSLRGCIGTFEAVPLQTGLAEYAILRCPFLPKYALLLREI